MIIYGTCRNSFFREHLISLIRKTYISHRGVIVKINHFLESHSYGIDFFFLFYSYDYLIVRSLNLKIIIIVLKNFRKYFWKIIKHWIFCQYKKNILIKLFKIKSSNLKIDNLDVDNNMNIIKNPLKEDKTYTVNT